jgi:hypothetical protein
VFGLVSVQVIVEQHDRTTFWHTVFVFGVLLDQMVVELYSRTPFWVLRISAYRFRVWRSVGCGDC